MSVVSLLGVNVVNNPSKFTDKYVFEITFECLEQLQKGMYFPCSYSSNPGDRKNKQANPTNHLHN